MRHHQFALAALADCVSSLSGAFYSRGQVRQEMTVKLDAGQLIAMVQEADEVVGPGDRVRVLTGGGASRGTR